MPLIFPDSTFVDKVKVRGSLYDFGEYPGLLLDETSSSVVGEVHEVDDETLNRLDDIEAGSHYLRKQLEISFGNRAEMCWVYVFDPEFYSRLVLIESGDWIEYAKTRTGQPTNESPYESFQS